MVDICPLGLCDAYMIARQYAFSEYLRRMRKRMKKELWLKQTENRIAAISQEEWIRLLRFERYWT